MNHEFRFAVGDSHASVQVTVQGRPGPQLRVALPSLLPRRGPSASAPNRKRGGLSLTASASGKELDVRPLLPGSFLVTTAGAEAVTIRYQLPIVGRAIPIGLGQRYPHAYEKDGKQTKIRYHEAFVLRGPDTWLRVDEGVGEQRVKFDLPAGMQAVALLPAAADGSFVCDGYAALADAPMHIGKYETLKFESSGRQHRVVLSGFGRDRTKRDEFQAVLARLVASNVHSMGPLPYRNYTFLFGRIGTARRTGGSATGLAAPAGHRNGLEFTLHTLKATDALLLEIARAHRGSWARNHFHPAGWQAAFPNSSLTHNAWFRFGTHEYQAELAVVRAGLANARNWWTRTIASHINALQRDPRRLEISAAETSGRMYSDTIRPDGPHPVLRGLLIALLLDVEVRSHTAGRKSLDDVLRRLAAECERKRRGYTTPEILAACEGVAGRKFRDFFARYVVGVDELPLTDTLAKIGIDARPSSKQRADGPPPRWQVRLVAKPPAAALQRRTELTRVVVK